MQGDESENHMETLPEKLLQLLSAQTRHTLHHVLGAIEILAEDSLCSRQIKHLSRCRRNVHELLRVVNDVSELVDYRTVGDVARPFALSEMLAEFASLIQSLAERKGLTLRWSVSREVPRLINGYREALETSLYRLVDNSLNNTEHGEVTITAKWQPLAPGSDSGKIMILVGDTGPGIPAPVLEDLTHPQWNPRNLGLGLRLVRKNLESIGGCLEVVRSTAKGTEVAITFPATIALSDPAPADILHADSSGGLPLRLLVAEDSDDSFAVFEDFVKDEGHRVTRARNGAEAVREFESGEYDLVVMDANMPVMDGYTATRTIREWETEHGRNRAPILLLSADDTGKQLRMGASAGCSGYLAKPTPKRELIYALRHYSQHPHLGI